MLHSLLPLQVLIQRGTGQPWTKTQNLVLGLILLLFLPLLVPPSTAWPRELCGKLFLDFSALGLGSSLLPTIEKGRKNNIKAREISTKPANNPLITACHRTIHRINLLQTVLPGTWHHISLLEKDKNLSFMDSQDVQDVWPAQNVLDAGEGERPINEVCPSHSQRTGTF